MTATPLVHPHDIKRIAAAQCQYQQPQPDRSMSKVSHKILAHNIYFWTFFIVTARIFMDANKHIDLYLYHCLYYCLWTCHLYGRSTRKHARWCKWIHYKDMWIIKRFLFWIQAILYRYQYIGCVMIFSVAFITLTFLIIIPLALFCEGCKDVPSVLTLVERYFFMGSCRACQIILFI
jgi:hypothetical protein